MGDIGNGYEFAIEAVQTLSQFDEAGTWMKNMIIPYVHVPSTSMTIFLTF